MKLAECASLDLADLFISPDETPEPPIPAAKAIEICRTCRVRNECLDFAIEYNMVGTWGGTSHQQRELLKQNKLHTHCVICGSDLVIIQSPHELCLSCGMTWRIGNEEEVFYQRIPPPNEIYKPCNYRVVKCDGLILYCGQRYNHRGDHGGRRTQENYRELLAEYKRLRQLQAIARRYQRILDNTARQA